MRSSGHGRVRPSVSIYGQLNGKYAVRWRPQAYAITVSRFGGASRTASNPPHTPLLRAR
jgi:hypothetical protein